MDLSIVLRNCGLLCILLLAIVTSSSSPVSGLANKKGIRLRYIHMIYEWRNE